MIYLIKIPNMPVFKKTFRLNVIYAKQDSKNGIILSLYDKQQTTFLAYADVSRVDSCTSEFNFRLRLEVRVRTPKSQLLLAQSAECYKFVILRGVEISFNFCLMTTLTLILTLGPSRRLP